MKKVVIVSSSLLNEENCRICKNNIFLIAFFILLININFISAQTYTLKVTDEHPFFLNGEWVAAKDLKVGDLLFTDEGKEAKITSIKEVYDNVDVYNLHVDGLNDYFAEDVLVHNKAQEYITFLGSSNFNGAFEYGKYSFQIPKQVVERLGLKPDSEVLIIMPDEYGLRDVVIAKGPFNGPALQRIYGPEYDVYGAISARLRYDPITGRYSLEIPYSENMDFFNVFTNGDYDFYQVEGSKITIRPKGSCSCLPITTEKLTISRDFMSLARSRKITEFGQMIGKNLEPGTPERAVLDAVHDIPYDPDAPLEQRLASLRAKRKALLDSGLFTEPQIEFILRSGICGPEKIPPYEQYMGTLGADAEAANRNVQNYLRLHKLLGLQRAGLDFDPKSTGVAPTYCVEEMKSMIRRGFLASDKPWKLDAYVFYEMNGKPVFLDPLSAISPNGAFAPLEGWYYVLILVDGTAYIHQNLNVVLKMYPYKYKPVKKGKRDCQIETVHSLTRIYLVDGKFVKNADGTWPIQNVDPSGTTHQYQVFRDSLILRMDSLSP